MLVGSADPHVLKLNRRTRAALRCSSQLTSATVATYLVEKPGTRTEVAFSPGTGSGAAAKIAAAAAAEGDI